MKSISIEKRQKQWQKWYLDCRDHAIKHDHFKSEAEFSDSIQFRREEFKSAHGVDPIDPVLRKRSSDSGTTIKFVGEVAEEVLVPNPGIELSASFLSEAGEVIGSAASCVAEVAGDVIGGMF